MDETANSGGHLFLDGDLTAIACDGLLVPTSGRLGLKKWQSLGIDPEKVSLPDIWLVDRYHQVEHAAGNREEQRIAGQDPAIWLGNIGHYGAGFID